MTSAYLLAHFETKGGSVRYLGSRIHGESAHSLTTTMEDRCVLDVIEGRGHDYEAAVQNVEERLALVPELAPFRPDADRSPGDDEAVWRSRYEMVHRAAWEYLASAGASDCRERLVRMLDNCAKMRWDLVCLSRFAAKDDRLSLATMEAFREIVFRRSTTVSPEAIRWAKGEERFHVDSDATFASVAVAFEAGRMWEREHR